MTGLMGLKFDKCCWLHRSVQSRPVPYLSESFSVWERERDKKEGGELSDEQREGKVWQHLPELTKWVSWRFPQLNHSQFVSIVLLHCHCQVEVMVWWFFFFFRHFWWLYVRKVHAVIACMNSNIVYCHLLSLDQCSILRSGWVDDSHAVSYECEWAWQLIWPGLLQPGFAGVGR